MPLFKCTKCGALENTALGDYWYRKDIKKLPPICSECSEGKWHGQFPKQTPEDAGFEVGPDGFYREISEAAQPSVTEGG